MDAWARNMFVLFTKSTADCQACHSVHKTLRTCAKLFKSLFFPQKTNFQKNRQAIDAGNARLNKCKQNDLTDVIKGANTGSVCAAFLILGYNPTPVIQQ